MGGTASGSDARADVGLPRVGGNGILPEGAAAAPEAACELAAHRASGPVRAVATRAFRSGQGRRRSPRPPRDRGAGEGGRVSRPPAPVSLTAVRRLAIARQHLAGKLPGRVTPQAIVDLVRDLGYVQWDPVGIVAPSHLLTLWARLGDFRPATLERLLWEEKRLFEHWTPMASLVRTEDYPLFASLMRRYPGSLSHSWGAQRTEARQFLAAHRALRTRVLRELREGPRRAGEFRDHARTRRDDGDWQPGSDVAEMLFHLLMQGEVMVVGHRGNENLWGLADRFLPAGVDRQPLSEAAFERAAALRSLRALGAATPPEIAHYFVRGRYEHLRRTLARLEAASAVRRVNVEGFGPRDERYALEEDVPVLESADAGPWEPRMSLVPPFDNLVGSPARVQRLFGFTYVREQFLPAAKRRFGTYVLPIVWGERLIGRIDPRLDRAAGILEVLAVHAEPDAPEDRETASRLAETIARLAAFAGARRVHYGPTVPTAWRSELR